MHVTGWVSRWADQLSRFKRGNSLLLALVVLLAIIALIDSTWHALVDGIGTHSIDIALILALICVFGALANHVRKRDDERHRDERQAVEQRASLRMNQYETALNTMRQGVVLVDGDERIVVCNKAYLSIYGHSSDIIGCHLIDVLRQRAALGNFNRDPEEYRRETVAKLASGANTSWLNKTNDGRYILIQNTPMAGGGWLSTHDDVTEKHRYEEELTASRAQALVAEKNAKAAHEHLKEAFEVVPEALVMFDADDRIVLWNKRYKDIHVDYPDMIRAGCQVRGPAASRIERQSLSRRDRPRGRMAGRAAGASLVCRTASPNIGSVIAGCALRSGARRMAAAWVFVSILPISRTAKSRSDSCSNRTLCRCSFHDIDSKAILSANDSMVRHYGYSNVSSSCAA